MFKKKILKCHHKVIQDITRVLFYAFNEYKIFSPANITVTLSQHRLLCSSMSPVQILISSLCIIHSRPRGWKPKVYTYLCLAYLLTSAEWHPGFEDNYGTVDDQTVEDLLRFVCGMISGASGWGKSPAETKVLHTCFNVVRNDGYQSLALGSIGIGEIQELNLSSYKHQKYF